MAGVPRSKGCGTCRRKKKGCDLKQPKCSPCERLQTACHYEERRWTFVDQNSVHAPTPEPRGDDHPSPHPESQHDSSGSDESVVLNPSLNCTAFEMQIEEDFWTVYLPTAEPPTPSALGEGVRAAGWLPVMRYLACQDKTARLAFNACAFMTLGRLRDDEALMHQGTHFYSRALRQTNRLLEHPVLFQSNAILAAIRFLACYELFRGDRETTGISSQGHDWQKHIDGACRILELRGPEKCIDPKGHQIFVTARSSSIISGCMSKKAYSFSSPDWTEIPWRQAPRDLRDELIDAMTLLPELLKEQEDLLVEMGTSAPTSASQIFSLIAKGQAIMGRCMHTVKALRDWEERTYAICKRLNNQWAEQESWDPVESTGPIEDAFQPNRLREVCFSFGYGLFDTICYYWFACVTLYARILVTHHTLLRFMSHTMATTPCTPSSPSWLHPDPYAAAIAYNCHLFFRPEAGLWGTAHAISCMSAAANYYAATGRHDCEEMTEMRRVLKSARARKFSVGFLASVAAAGLAGIKYQGTREH
jgi:hypothetical protein